MKNKLRTSIGCFLYVIALLSFMGAVTATSSASLLDFTDLSRIIFCGLAVICVISATLIWKTNDTHSKRLKIIVMFIAVTIIVGGGCIDNYLDHNTGTHEYTADMYKISEAVAARFETADGKSVVIDSEIKLLTSLADLELQAAPMTPVDDPEDWIYWITFNPTEKVPNGEEIVVCVHETYIQIGVEYYLPKDGVNFDTIMEWFDGKAAYFFS